MTRPSTCYRLKPFFRNAGWIGFAGVASFGLGSVYAAYFNIDKSFPNPLLAATCFGLFCSCFGLMSAWLLLLDRRYRLCITDVTLRQCGVLIDRTVKLSAIEQMRWRRFPAGGSVRLLAADRSIAIELGNFSENERAEIIAFLRRAVPDAQQCGWDAFRRQFEDGPTRKELSRRGGWFGASFFGAWAVWGLAQWALEGSEPHLWLAIVNAAGIVYLVWRLRTSASEPRHGEPGVGADSR